MTSSHFAETCVDFMIENSINFIEKYENPANLPECRSIERFWAKFKEKLYEGDKKMQNLSELELRAIETLKKIDTTWLETLVAGIHRKLVYIGRHGVIENR